MRMWRLLALAEPPTHEPTRRHRFLAATAATPSMWLVGTRQRLFVCLKPEVVPSKAFPSHAFTTSWVAPAWLAMFESVLPKHPFQAYSGGRIHAPCNMLRQADLHERTKEASLGWRDKRCGSGNTQALWAAGIVGCGGQTSSNKILWVWADPATTFVMQSKQAARAGSCALNFKSTNRLRPHMSQDKGPGPQMCHDWYTAVITWD